MDQPPKTPLDNDKPHTIEISLQLLVEFILLHIRTAVLFLQHPIIPINLINLRNQLEEYVVNLQGRLLWLRVTVVNHYWFTLPSYVDVPVKYPAHRAFLIPGKRYEDLRSLLVWGQGFFTVLVGRLRGFDGFWSVVGRILNELEELAEEPD
ncbi:hypothetical protein EJ08DRAFT_738213 [Tothia fuscella]|uniref:Uncharacterized protein n=1 Tax=Tothia fuscella TaxID=1048955 RepID=A0A9P4TU83_9PEZI|nr:hypothetical protein EJ08DRAFT_738213 [Tothia fuscella]